MLQNDTYFKSGQNWLENNHLASLIQILDTLCRIIMQKMALMLTDSIIRPNIIFLTFSFSFI